MKKNLRKIVSLVLVLAMTLAISVPAFAASSDNDGIIISKQKDGTYRLNQDRQFTTNSLEQKRIKLVAESIYRCEDGILLSKVNETTLVPVEKISINPMETNQVENAIKQYGLHKETAQALRDYSQKTKSGAVKVNGDVIYYAPLNMSLNSTRTYTGFDSKQYYEEKLQFSDHSASTEVDTDLWGNYVNTTIHAAAEEALSGAISGMSKFAGGSWTIASLFLGSIPSSVPSTDQITHEANKQESKTKVWTYLSDSDGYHFGCLTEYCSVYYENRIIYNGGSYMGKNTSKSYYQSDDYNAPDKRAYYASAIGGVTELISSHSYGGATFDSI